MEIRKNIEKKFKNLFPALFLAKTGGDGPRKREKNFSPEFRSYSTRARKLKKNIKKSRKIIKLLPCNFFSQHGMRYDEKERKKF